MIKTEIIIDSLLEFCKFQKRLSVSRIITLLIMIFTALFSFAQKKQVCFSFDDLPVVSYGAEDTCFQKELSEKLISSLKRNNIPAIGFVNEGKLYNGKDINSFQAGLLKKWIDSGLDAGNHTFSHPDYNLISLEDYSRDILKGEKITKELLKSRGLSVKYFRHPFLHTGSTKEKADSLSAFLHKHGYEAAPVTIDNEDYLFAHKYAQAKAKNDPGMMRQIGRDYVMYMERKLKYFERQAEALFGRDIPQILLVHASLLNADYADPLAHLFINNNYEFVSMDEALRDSAYKTDITVYGKWGISWLDRWALSRGRKGSFFKDDPEVPDYIGK